MIHELLAEGAENARTGKELSEVLGVHIRDITAQIEVERREGQPICAATGDRPGYFLPATVTELQKYCDALKGRAIEVFKTRQALIRVLKQLQDCQTGDKQGE